MGVILVEDKQFEQQYIFDQPEEHLELKITNFEGPLDLLLTLVKENKKGYICYAKKKKSGIIVATCKKVKGKNKKEKNI